MNDQNGFVAFVYLYDKFLAKTAFLCQNIEIEKVYTYILTLNRSAFYTDDLP